MSARRHRVLRRLSAGKLTLRLIAERAEASPICGGAAAAAAAARTPSHLGLLAIPGVICSTIYAKFYTFLNIHKLSTLLIQSFMKANLVFSVTHTCYVYYSLNITFQASR